MRKKNDFFNMIYLMVKRLFDICSSFIAVIVLSPVFLVIAILIKLEDHGPVFYAHKRLGLHGNLIKVFKFRSMKLNADKLEEMLTPEQLEQYHKEFKIENDPRITKIGNFIRKTSLDELPQLINILRGDLSVVGPRPIMKEELDVYSEEEKQLFLSIKPGLTGYWQAYARNNATYASGIRQKMELYYVDNASIWLDIKIIFKTVASVFKRSGAM